MLDTSAISRGDLSGSHASAEEPSTLFGRPPLAGRMTNDVAGDAKRREEGDDDPHPHQHDRRSRRRLRGQLCRDAGSPPDDTGAEKGERGGDLGEPLHWLATGNEEDEDSLVSMAQRAIAASARFLALANGTSGLAALSDDETVLSPMGGNASLRVARPEEAEGHPRPSHREILLPRGVHDAEVNYNKQRHDDESHNHDDDASRIIDQYVSVVNEKDRTICALIGERAEGIRRCAAAEGEVMQLRQRVEALETDVADLASHLSHRQRECDTLAALVVERDRTTRNAREHLSVLLPPAAVKPSLDGAVTAVANHVVAMRRQQAATLEAFATQREAVFREAVLNRPADLFADDTGGRCLITECMEAERRSLLRHEYDQTAMRIWKLCFVPPSSAAAPGPRPTTSSGCGDGLWPLLGSLAQWWQAQRADAAKVASTLCDTLQLDHFSDLLDRNATSISTAMLYDWMSRITLPPGIGLSGKDASSNGPDDGQRIRCDRADTLIGIRGELLDGLRSTLRWIHETLLPQLRAAEEQASHWRAKADGYLQRSASLEAAKEQLQLRLNDATRHVARLQQSADANIDGLRHRVAECVTREAAAWKAVKARDRSLAQQRHLLAWVATVMEGLMQRTNTAVTMARQAFQAGLLEQLSLASMRARQAAVEHRRQAVIEAEQVAAQRLEDTVWQVTMAHAEERHQLRIALQHDAQLQKAAWRSSFDTFLARQVVPMLEHQEAAHRSHLELWLEFTYAAFASARNDGARLTSDLLAQRAVDRSATETVASQMVALRVALQQLHRLRRERNIDEPPAATSSTAA